MRTVIAFALALLACLSLAEEPWERNLAEVRAMKIGAPRKWALVIGASDYQELGRLKYARNDAQDFAKALIDDFTFKPEDVTLLVDQGRAEEAPTAKNILGSLDKLTKDPRLDRGDLFIFYFAGHGVGTKQGDFLCSTDTKKTNVEQAGLPIREVMKRIVATGMKNVLIIADACRAGEKNPFGSELQELGRKTNLAVLLGCAPGKRSYEYPELKHGAFTHFLLQNMKEPSLRELSGGLWASRIAERVEKQVFEFTERDFGKYAQQPIGWNDKRQDVLLAQFAPNSQFVQLAFAQAFDILSKKGDRALPLAIQGMAVFLRENGLHARAIEFLKMLDSLGMMTPRTRFSLANDLLVLGRDAEAVRQLDQLLELPQTHYLRLNAIVLYPGDKFSADQKLEAGIRMWRLDHDPGDAVFLAYLGELAFPVNREKALRELSAFFGKKSRIGLFFLAEQERVKGNKSSATKLYWQSLDASGPSVAVHQSLLRLLELQFPEPDDGELLAIHSRGIRDDEGALYFWMLQEVIRLRDNGDTEAMMRMVRNALRATATPDEILAFVQAARSHAGELEADLAKPLERHPLSWQVYAAEWLVKFMKAPSPQFTIDERVLKYASDPVAVRVALFSAMEDTLEDEKLSSTEKLQFNTKFFISVNKFNDKFGLDEDLWNRLQRWAENSRRTLQIGALAKAKLFPAVYAGRGSASLLTTAMRIAMNAGDDASVQKLWQVAENGGAMKTELGWQYLVYRLLRGDTKTAEALLPKMSNPPVFVGDKAPTMVRAYLDLLSGASPEKIRPILEKNDPTGFQDQYLWTMAMARCGKQDEALSFFVGATIRDDEYDLYSTGAGFQLLWKALAAQGKTEELASLGELASRYFGNPCFAEVAYAANPKLGDYAGTLTFDARYMGIEGDRPMGDDTLTMTISADGTVQVAMGMMQARGQIDRFGNLSASGTWGLKPISMTMKIAPQSIYATNSDKGPDQAEVLTDRFEQIYFELSYRKA